MTNLKEAAEKQKEIILLSQQILDRQLPDTGNSRSIKTLAMQIRELAKALSQSSPIQPNKEAFIERLRISTCNGMRELTEERAIQAFEECVQKTPKSDHVNKTCVENEGKGAWEKDRDEILAFIDTQPGIKPSIGPRQCNYYQVSDVIELLKRYAAQFKQPVEGKVIDFAVWYSGMDRAKVEKAYERYLIEHCKPKTDNPK